MRARRPRSRLGELARRSGRWPRWWRSMAMTTWLAAVLVACPVLAQAPLLNLEFEAVEEGQQYVDHAWGEGPALLPGPLGRCLDLTAASRAGGLGDQPVAGGSVQLTDPRLDSLAEFSVVLWLQPTEARSQAARVLHKEGSWELMHGGSALALYLTGAGGKRHYPSERIDRRPPGSWVFFAGSVGGGQVTTRIGTASGGFVRTAGATAGRAVGNGHERPGDRQFQGIRPFQGQLDRLRIYPQALAPEQVAKLFAEDCAALHAAGRSPRWGRSPTGDALQPAALGRAVFVALAAQSRRGGRTASGLRRDASAVGLWRRSGLRGPDARRGAVLRGHAQRHARLSAEPGDHDRRGLHRPPSAISTGSSCRWATWSLGVPSGRSGRAARITPTSARCSSSPPTACWRSGWMGSTSTTGSSTSRTCRPAAPASAAAAWPASASICRPISRRSWLLSWLSAIWRRSTTAPTSRPMTS